MDSISLRECLDFMDAGLIFSMKFCTYDERRPRNSGKIRQYQEVILLRHEEKIGDDTVTLERDESESVKRVLLSKEEIKLKEKRNPAHGEHMTRNVRICIGKRPTAKIVKIHLDLIVRFNGRKVILP